jgi:predicted phosphodiesterase
VRRIAVYSDVHGNLAALSAVTADMEREGLSERYCLGDLVGLGPHPNDVIELVRASGDSAIQGNYDRAIALHRDTPGSDFPTAQEALDGAESYAFTVSEIDRAHADFLHELPHGMRIEHEGVRLLLCHGTPRLVNEGVDRSDAPGRLIEIVRDAETDVVCAGHTHTPFHRSIPTLEGPVHWVNAGSVGRPRDGDNRAAWVEIVLGEQREVLAATSTDTACRPVGHTHVWLGVLIHRVAYDVEAVVRDMDARGLPHTLALGLRSGLEEHNQLGAERSEAVEPEEAVEEAALPCGHAQGSCTCRFDDRVAAYESLARVYRGHIAEAAAAIRTLPSAMRGCRINRNVDEAAIYQAFQAADAALRTAAGRTAFVEERERLIGLRVGFDPFVNVLSPHETTYLSTDSSAVLGELEELFIRAAYTTQLSTGGLQEDHISTELGFMAYCLRGAAAGDAAAFERARDFFAHHLAEWVVLFAVVIGQQAREPVMRYAGLVLDKHITCEGAIFRYDVPEHEALRGVRGTR